MDFLSPLLPPSSFRIYPTVAICHRDAPPNAREKENLFDFHWKALLCRVAKCSNFPLNCLDLASLLYTASLLQNLVFILKWKPIKTSFFFIYSRLNLGSYIISEPCIRWDSNIDGQLWCGVAITFSPINLQECRVRGGTCAWQGSYGRCKLRKTVRPTDPISTRMRIKFSRNSERPMELLYDMARKLLWWIVAATSQLPNLQLPSPHQRFTAHTGRRVLKTFYRQFFSDNPRVFGAGMPVKRLQKGKDINIINVISSLDYF